MLRIFITLAAAALFSWATATNAVAASPPTASTKSKVALIIGNSRYVRGALENPVNDATDIAQLLPQYGFEVIRVLDADKQKMREAVRRYTAMLGPKTIALMFYAGHGMQVNGKNYLIPTDANIRGAEDVDDQAVALDWVMQNIEAHQPRFNILILDACRNNPFARSYGGGGLAAIDGPAGSLIAFATGPSKVASDGAGRNGLYTGHLLKHINTPNLRVEEIFKRVRIGVMEHSGGVQIPWENSSLTEDFVLNDQGGASTSAPNVPPAEMGWLAKADMPALRAYLSTHPVDSARNAVTVAFAQTSKNRPLRREALKLSVRDCDKCPGLTEVTDPAGAKLFAGTDLVTVDEYQQCVAAGACRAAKPTGVGGDARLASVLPINNVSLNDATRYVQWLNIQSKSKRYHIPTQDEWMHLFKSGYFLPSGKTLAATKSLCEIGNFYDLSGALQSAFPWAPNTCNDAFPSVAPVGAFMPSLDGLFDMVGNLWQWTRSCHKDAVVAGSSQCIKQRLVGGSWATAPRWNWADPPEIAAEPDLATDLFGIRVMATNK
jgi:uncharacterized caspase-like protein